ncbi:MAG: hypothetical protein ACI841_000686 [Planctomycetota bacterium]|jgi:hypothetical protein
MAPLHYDQIGPLISGHFRDVQATAKPFTSEELILLELTGGSLSQNPNGPSVPSVSRC